MEKILITRFSDEAWEYGRAHDWFVDVIFHDNTFTFADADAKEAFKDTELWSAGFTLHEYVREFSKEGLSPVSYAANTPYNPDWSLMFVMRDVAQADDAIWEVYQDDDGVIMGRLVQRGGGV